MIQFKKPLIIIIMGVSGSGKSTIGELLSAELGIDFYDGDDFHPEENIKKMSKGLPLNDLDRAGWLEAIHTFGLLQIQQKRSCIIACSALKKVYRNLLRKDMEDQLKFVYLKGDIETIRLRLSERSSHFMPPALLQSQFNTLEPPVNAITVSLELSPSEIVNQIVKELRSIAD